MLILVMFWLLIKLCAPWYMYIIACIASMEILFAWAVLMRFFYLLGSQKE